MVRGESNGREELKQSNGAATAFDSDRSMVD